MIKFALNFTYLLLILETYCIFNYYLFFNKLNLRFYQNYFLNTFTKFIFRKKEPIIEQAVEPNVEQNVQSEPQPEKEEYWSNMVNVVDKLNNMLTKFNDTPKIKHKKHK